MSLGIPRLAFESFKLPSLHSVPAGTSVLPNTWSPVSPQRHEPFDGMWLRPAMTERQAEGQREWQPVQAGLAWELREPDVSVRAQEMAGESIALAIQLARELFRQVPGAVRVAIDVEPDPEIEQAAQLVLSFRTIASASQIAGAEARLNEWLLSDAVGQMHLPVALSFEFV